MPVPRKSDFSPTCDRRLAVVLVLFFASVFSAFADTHYVSPAGGHNPPFVNWTDAATDIQSAISAAVAGDTVLVSNGTYNTGGVAVYGSMTNRIAVTNAIAVQSVHGPEYTFIVGQGPLGDGAIRCAYVGSNATLMGFTLTNGYTRASGDYYKERSGGGVWCESSAVVSNCVISGNSAKYMGGGTCYGSAAYGGTIYGVIQNCTISGNSAAYGGGTIYGTIQNCTISRNSAAYGGGTYYGTIQNCIVYYNSADNWYEGNYSYSCSAPEPPGTGNITNQPGLSGLSNPHIVSASPCIDRGTNQSWMAGALDTDGEPRIINGVVDIGCDEFNSAGVTGAVGVAIGASHTNVAIGFAARFEASIEGRASGYEWQWGDGERSSNVCVVNHGYSATGEYQVVLTAWNNDTSASATVTIHVASTYTNYVSLSGSHILPYDSWATAATNIQAAISANRQGGGVVLVSNGVYDTGGVAVYGSMTNRIAITNAVTVQSVHGPEYTFIVGQGPLGTSAVRCAYIGANARLVGFTLTNGYTRSNGYMGEINGGGVYCDNGGMVENCTISGNSAREMGGGVYCLGGAIKDCLIRTNNANAIWNKAGGGVYCDNGGTVENCIISGNSTPVGWGGGVCCLGRSIVRNCSIIGNISEWDDGGGVYSYYGTIQNCTISGNSSRESGYGGGVLCHLGSTVEHCLIIENFGDINGGGIYSVSDDVHIRNCTIVSNSTLGNGGGTYGGTIQNCTISGNSAKYYGGGTYGGTIQNCTISGNSAKYDGGGTYDGTIQNCIVYYNSTFASSGDNWYGGTYSYSCSAPEPPGTGNITNQPGLSGLSNPHIVPASPCIDRGTNQSWMAGALDADGEPRIINGLILAVMSSIRRASRAPWERPLARVIRMW